MLHKLITFGGNSISIAYRDPRPERIVDFLYRYLPTGQPGPDPHTGYQLLARGDPEQLYLQRGDEPDPMLLYKGESDAAAADNLLGDSCYRLVYHSRGGLVFHAGGLHWQGKGLMLPGQVSAGKTTLTAWLVAQGLDYLTDELVFVPDGADSVQTFTRPLNLKKPAREVLKDYIDYEGQAEHISSSSFADLVPHTLLSPNRTPPPIPDQTPVNLIIFPHYQPDGDFELRPLSRAQAGLALMECLVNARNLEGHGFAQAARLAKTAPAYQLHYSHFDQLGDQIRELLRTLP